MSMTSEEILADEVSVDWADKLFKELDADERYSQVTKTGKELNSKGKRREQQIANMREGVYNAVLALIEKDPAYANLNNEELVKEALTPTGRSADQIAQDLAESKRKADFMPLVQPTKMPKADGTIVIGQPWMQMSQKALWEKAKEMGYDMNIEKDRKDFFNTLGQYSEQIDRAQVVNEFDNSLPGIVASMAYPTAASEARKQALTGNYDDTKMWQSVGLDGSTQLAQLATPGGAAIKGWMTPVIQGAAEATREGMQYGLGLGDESFNPSQVATATVAGATTPALKGTLQGVISKAGSTGKKVAEGIEETTKGTAKDLEQQAFKKTWDKGRKIDEQHKSSIKAMSDIDEQLDDFDEIIGIKRDDVDDVARVIDWKSKGIYDESSKASELYKKWKEIYPDLTPEEFFKNPNKFTEQEALVGIRPAEKHSFYFNGKKIDTNLDEPPHEYFTGELTKNNQWLKDQLPETYKDVTGEVSKEKKIGNLLGKGVELIGGKIEPTYKVNPVTVVSGVLNGTISMDDIQKSTKNEIPLEEQEWFKNLKPEQKKLIKAIQDGKELLESE